MGGGVVVCVEEIPTLLWETIIIKLDFGGDPGRARLVSR